MAEKITSMAALLAERWPLIFRTGMYFLLGALPILCAGFNAYGKGEIKANTWLLVALFFHAAYEGLVGVKAYFDGSAATINATILAKRNGNGNGDVPAPAPDLTTPTLPASASSIVQKAAGR